MNTADPDSRHSKLAADLQRIVRSTPHRPAPVTLEARVLAAVAAPRAPSLNQGYESWSPILRLVFLVAAAGVAASSVRLLVPLPISEAWGTLRGTIDQFGQWTAAVAEAAATLRSIVAGAAPDWLRIWGQLGLLMFAALYVATLAAGAAAWRWWQGERALR